MEKGRVVYDASGFGLNRTRSPFALDESTQLLLDHAWKIRLREHQPVLTVVKPFRTLAVSVTGADCQLQCRHCGGHYLATMTPVQQALTAYVARGATSCLISGGCDFNGRVPVDQYREVMLLLREQGSRLNCHVGTCDRQAITKLAGVVDCVSFDLVGDDATLHEVYGVHYGTEQLWDSFALLSEAIPTYPHICIGLRGGSISGEYAVLERLADANPKAVVFLIFRPTPGTPYARCLPPSEQAVARLLATARVQLPHTPLYLGCMRPSGRYRTSIDQLAVWAGLQRIVKPMPAAVQLAQSAGLRIQRQEECCVL